MSLILKLLEGKERINYSRRDIIHDVIQDLLITGLFLQSCKSNNKRRKKYAILLIDTFKPQHEEYKNIIEVLKEANNQNIPVYEISSPRESTADILLEYKNNNWFSIEKRYTDAFQGTNLGMELKSREITNVIVMGYSEHVCIKDTAETASKMFRVHTSLDVIQSTLEQEEALSQEKGFLNLKEKSKKFYEKKTDLVRNYYELPIFRKRDIRSR